MGTHPNGPSVLAEQPSTSLKEKISSLPYMNLRAEQLSWQQFVELTNKIEELK